MNDRLKFRTWIPDLKFFKYWGWIEENHYIGMCATGECSMPELLQGYTSQCTGLKDKNGKLIYEKDIVAFTNPYEDNKLLTFVVEWENNYTSTGFNLGKEFAKTVEIIGNIYENPGTYRRVK